MGFSCTVAASNVTKVWEVACRASTGQSNTFVVKRVKYFHEESRIEEDDGGIKGTVYMCLTNNRCRKVGDYHIDGKGKLITAPDIMKNIGA